MSRYDACDVPACTICRAHIDALLARSVLWAFFSSSVSSLQSIFACPGNILQRKSCFEGLHQAFVKVLAPRSHEALSFSDISRFRFHEHMCTYSIILQEMPLHLPPFLLVFRLLLHSVRCSYRLVFQNLCCNKEIVLCFLEAMTEICLHDRQNPENYKHPLLKNALIESVQTKWGTVSLVQAHIALLKAAVKDPKNKSASSHPFPLLCASHA